MAFNILNHSAVPKHEILSDDEIEEIFADVDYDISQLPKIRVKASLTLLLNTFPCPHICDQPFTFCSDRNISNVFLSLTLNILNIQP